MPFCPKRVYITSNSLPQGWYEKGKEDVHYKALTRRFDHYWDGQFQNGDEVWWGYIGQMKDGGWNPVCTYRGDGDWDVDMIQISDL